MKNTITTLKKHPMNSSVTLVALVVLLFSSIELLAQNKIGNNPATLNNDAVLELEHDTKGLLLPRVELVSATSPSPLSAHVAGMVVYNTATIADLEPGYYYNDGTIWRRMAFVTPSAGSGGNDLINANGILVTGGTQAVLKATSLRLDSTAIAKFVGQSPVRDSVINGVVTSSDFRDSVLSITGAGAVGADNGLSMSGNNVEMGGDLYKNTYINFAGFALSLIGDGFLDLNSASTPSAPRLTADGFIQFGADTDYGIGHLFNDAIGEKYGVAQTGSAQGINSTRLYSYEYITFGKYTSPTAFTEHARFSIDGKFGLGQTNPTEKLHVNGKVRIDSLASGASGDSLVTVGSDGVLKKKTMTDAMDSRFKFFYAPTIAISVAATGTGFTLNLYNQYQSQFASPAVKNTSAPSSIPVFSASELNYYITSFDNTVLSNITISDAGVMTYDVISTSPSFSSFLNVVFTVK